MVRMKCTILASGSKGNCIFIENDCSALLIDAGLSGKETFLRIARNGLDAGKIQAVAVTHEHGDHIRGLDVLSRRLEVPVFGTEGTLNEFLCHRRASHKPINCSVCRSGEPFIVGDFHIDPFTTSHDAAEPCGFIVKENGTSCGICTDTGIISSSLLNILRGCDGIILESNHCPDMLRNGPYPESLKRRIRSKRGHLSNSAAAACLQAFGKDVPNIILAHLSEINNTPEKALLCARQGIGLFIEEKNLCVATQLGSTAESPQSMVL
jgi:phosphoribosyl 1,2-cyclic phosphodiesterase